MKRIWDMDATGEPWLGSLDNPDLMLLNPPRRKKKGKMPAALARYWREKYAGGGGHKRKKARAHGGKKRRGSYRSRPLSNPPMLMSSAAPAPRRRRKLGEFVSQFPNLKTIAGVAIGFVAPPMIWARVKGYLPASVQSLPVDANDQSRSALGYWVARAAVAVAPPLLVRRLFDRVMGNLMLVGGIVSIAVDVARYYMPSFMSGQPFLGYYTSGMVAGPAAAAPMLDSGPVRQSTRLGMYGSASSFYPGWQPPTRMTSTTPDRLDPSARF